MCWAKRFRSLRTAWDTMTPSPAAHSLSHEVAPHLSDQVVAHCWRRRRIRLSVAVAVRHPLGIGWASAYRVLEAGRA